MCSSDLGKANVKSMLTELADLGFAWRDIARMVGVSVPAVQKWRKGEKASGDSRIRVASLLAAYNLITEPFVGLSGSGGTISNHGHNLVSFTGQITGHRIGIIGMTMSDFQKEEVLRRILRRCASRKPVNR